MGDKIYYSTPEDQLKKLISQNLTIYDQDHALTGLRLFGYSNLIKSYRDPYILKSDDSIMYRDGVSFEQISSLYFFDKALRNTVMASMQDLEEHIKEIAANVIAQSFGVDLLLIYNIVITKTRESEKSASLLTAFFIQ